MARFAGRKAASCSRYRPHVCVQCWHLDPLLYWPRATGRRRRRGVCSGAPLPAETIELEANISRSITQTTQLTPLKGFDRLSNAGFTAEDIENVRRQFHESRGSHHGDAADGVLQEEEQGDGTYRSYAYAYA